MQKQALGAVFNCDAVFFTDRLRITNIEGMVFSYSFKMSGVSKISKIYLDFFFKLSYTEDIPREEGREND